MVSWTATSIIKVGVYHLHEELPIAQLTKEIVDLKATRTKRNYCINNHKTDRTPTLQKYCETVQKCEFQLNYKWDNTYMQWKWTVAVFCNTRWHEGRCRCTLKHVYSILAYVSSSSSTALQPRSGLGFPYWFHDGYNTMWVISSTIDLFYTPWFSHQRHLVATTTDSSGETGEHGWEMAAEFCLRNIFSCL
jgi:hypothetical protein